MIVKMPVGHGTAIASGLGWYSLSGATISKLVSAEAGSIAFLSNLMREIFSFFIIPFWRYILIIIRALHLRERQVKIQRFR